MTLQEVIADIHALDERLREYEMKYGMLSEDFYELYTNGGLRDEEEEIKNFGGWAAFYKMRQRRKAMYDEKKQEMLASLRSSSRGMVVLTPTTSAA